jgi:hypothetical protein
MSSKENPSRDSPFKDEGNPGRGIKTPPLVLTDDPADYPLFIEESTDDLFEFLQQFFTLFSEYAASPFYAFGESYGGKYAPAIALKIHQENQQREEGKLFINLGSVEP